MGVVWKIGDDINTDEIISSEYYPRPNLKEVGKFALKDRYPEFANNCKQGDVLIAGKNFGCGSSREYAPLALKYTGIKCIIAKSFARIFYRNAINIGLPILTSTDAYRKCEESDKVEVNLKTGRITNHTTEEVFKAQPVPAFALQIINEGGVVELLQKKEFEEIQNGF